MYTCTIGGAEISGRKGEGAHASQIEGANINRPFENILWGFKGRSPHNLLHIIFILKQDALKFMGGGGFMSLGHA